MTPASAAPASSQQGKPARAWREWLFGLLRWVIGGVFLWAGVLKVQNPQALADSVATFRLLPTGLIAPLALALPPFEILVGGLLVLGWRPRAVAFCALAVTVVFLVALGSAAARGLQVDCGCFGGGGDPLTGNGNLAVALTRDLLLLAGCLALYLRPGKSAIPVHDTIPAGPMPAA